MNLWLGVLVYLLAACAIFVVLWWLIVTTEGVYLGRGMVIWLYDLYARRYESIKGYDPATEAYFLGRPLLAALAPNTAPLVLDVATGTGRLPRALLGQPAFKGSIIALDLSREMLRCGAGRLAEGLFYGRVHLMHAPAEALPFPDHTFDLVTCLEALEFMAQPKTVIAELVRVTRPGGLLLLTNRRGRDTRLMPRKTWTREQALAIYQEEFGLVEVQIRGWQVDYDLVWARKAGQSQPRRARPLEEIWLCPACAQPAMVKNERGYHCSNCQHHVTVGEDGVIEVFSSPI